MKVYIAGKITGLSDADVFKKFYDAKKRLEAQGHIVMSPAVLALNKGFDHPDYMHICFAMIDVCDAVYLLKDWRKSKGARMEKSFAEKWCRTILYEDEATREDAE